MGYLINQRRSLERFLQDPALPLDNNVAERTFRLIALGRKIRLFAGRDDSAQIIAVLQSLVSTRQLHDVNPEAYIADVLVRIRRRGVKLKDLMPWNWTPATP